MIIRINENFTNNWSKFYISKILKNHKNLTFLTISDFKITIFLTKMLVYAKINITKQMLSTACTLIGWNHNFKFWPLVGAGEQQFLLQKIHKAKLKLREESDSSKITTALFCHTKNVQLKNSQNTILDLLKMTLGSRISQFQISIFDKLKYMRGLQERLYLQH